MYWLMNVILLRNYEKMQTNTMYRNFRWISCSRIDRDIRDDIENI